MTDNLDSLASMKYSGRGIIVGMTPSERPFLGYSLTGRSPPSQARELLLGEKTNTVRAEVTDPKQLEEGSPALLLYPAITMVTGQQGTSLIASNGAQTKLIYSVVHAWRNTPDMTPLALLDEAFGNTFWEYDKKEDRWIDLTSFEPDAPNNTPRINALIHNGEAAIRLIREQEGKTYRQNFSVPLSPGKGKLITTYAGGNEAPLLPFTGELLDVTFTSETAADIAESIYAAMGAGAESGKNYRVAAAVAIINPEVRGGLEITILNRTERGE